MGNITSFKQKEKYFIYSYIIIVFVGFIFLITQGLKTEYSWNVKLEWLFRICLFLINTIAPYVIWQHFIIDILSNHQRVIDKRLYISKSRKIIFRDRKNYFVFYGIVSLFIAFILLKFFGKTQIEKILILLVAFIFTVAINYLIICFLRKKFIIDYNKNLIKIKVYDKDYLDNVSHNKKVIHKSETNSIVLDKNDYLDLKTIDLLFDKCNGKIFLANDFSSAYNTLNVKNNDNFVIKEKGRFLSLIFLIQHSLIKDKEWDKAILELFDIHYDDVYKRNRNHYINVDTLQLSKMTLEMKINHIITTKAQMKYHN